MRVLTKTLLSSTTTERTTDKTQETRLLSIETLQNAITTEATTDKSPWRLTYLPYRKTATLVCHRYQHMETLEGSSARVISSSTPQTIGPVAKSASINLLVNSAAKPASFKSSSISLPPFQRAKTFPLEGRKIHELRILRTPKPPNFLSSFLHFLCWAYVSPATLMARFESNESN